MSHLATLNAFGNLKCFILTAAEKWRRAMTSLSHLCDETSRALKNINIFTEIIAFLKSHLLLDSHFRIAHLLKTGNLSKMRSDKS